MLKNFGYRDLTMIAISLEEEEESRIFLVESSGNRRIWFYAAKKKRPVEGELFRITLLPHLIDDETRLYQYFQTSVDVGVQPVGAGTP